MTTLRAWLTQAAQDLEHAELTFGHGTDNAWDEAVAIALGTLDWPDDATVLDRRLTEAQHNQLAALVTRRIQERVPVPMLLGHTQFANHRFLVAPDVMIPRSPIAELIRREFKPWLKRVPQRVLDLCSGGGCIGLSCALEFSDAAVDLVDLDPLAVSLSRQNIELHDLGARVQPFTGNLYEPLLATGATYDLIVSNPPYVPSADSRVRPAEFQHEPQLANDGGATGMDLVACILAGAGQFLAPDGLLVIEVGQWADVVEARWPNVPFMWPELEYGGEGVLLLDATVVAEHTDALAIDRG